MTNPASLFPGGGSPLTPNARPPHYITNAYYQAPGYMGTKNAGITTTINRCYYIPWAIWETHTFQGVEAQNNGAGDNGALARIMFFNDDGAAGGPGTLAKDFGQITLTAATAIRLLTSSWTPNPGIYWGAFWVNTASVWYPQGAYGNVATAGAGGFQAAHLLGDLSNASFGNTFIAEAHYVDTAYGAAPSTAVAPTASTFSNYAGGTGGSVPDFRLKG